MKVLFLASVLTFFAPIADAQSAPFQVHTAPLVSAQGVFLRGNDGLFRTSPLGTLKLELEVLEGDQHAIVIGVRHAGQPKSSVVLRRIVADDILATDSGKFIAIRSHESNRYPTRFTVFDLQGNVKLSRDVMMFSDPQVSPDGAYFAYRSATGVHVLDLAKLQEESLPSFDIFSLGRGGALIALPIRGEARVELWQHGALSGVGQATRSPRALALLYGSTALLLSKQDLVQLDLRSGKQRVLYRAPSGIELRDLMQSAGMIHVGRRASTTGGVQGSVLRLSPRGFPVQVQSGAMRPSCALGPAPVPFGRLPWPLAPNTNHPIGNSYGEYQNYGGSAYMHPGIDIMGADHQAVYAVHGGVVKARLTTSGSYHWRLAIANTASSGTSEGYLYAHLDLPSIAVDVGDTIVKGQYLGNLVPWPVASFTHTHFARIEDTGATWSGAWINTDNAHTDLMNHADRVPPVFDPARGSDLFAFCSNDSTTYQDPQALTGKVDIIARVSDTVHSPWRCAVQTIHYSVHPLGSPGSPIVDNLLSVNFDMLLDTYAGGPVDPFLVDLIYKQDPVCQTEGNYNSREFYHIITNSNGDQTYDAADVAEAWDTSQLSDGDYVISVRATDAANNETVATMIVTTANGNP